MENSFPFCKPESNPPEVSPVAVKYTQGSSKSLCVTELGSESLHICMSFGKDHNGWKLVREENERHDGAITCPEIRRVISVLVIGGNLNLRRKSTKISAKMNTPRTQVSVGGQVGVGGGAGGPPGFVVAVVGGPLGEGEVAPFVAVGFGGPLGEVELTAFVVVVAFADPAEGVELPDFVTVEEFDLAEPVPVMFMLTTTEIELVDVVVVRFVET